MAKQKTTSPMKIENTTCSSEDELAQLIGQLAIIMINKILATDEFDGVCSHIEFQNTIFDFIIQKCPDKKETTCKH